jgi:hypothetical protein
MACSVWQKLLAQRPHPAQVVVIDEVQQVRG